jgi:hypothetical protein
MNETGYWETLTIHRDGTFIKHQQHRIGSETYRGTYAVAEDGCVTFNVTSKQYDKGDIPTQLEAFDVDAVFQCRVAPDLHGHLLMIDIGYVPPEGVRVIRPQDVAVSWQRCYTTVSHEEQRQAVMDELQQMLQKKDNPE